VINTMPLATLDAFADHGDVGASLGADAGPAEELLEELCPRLAECRARGCWVPVDRY
jgi:hypothetical protein